MLKAEENEKLCRVGPGTPMGELMRWYWHPIAPSAELLENPVKKIRILGEDLVLYRDRSGGLGLIGDKCAHRSAGMIYGIPEEHGLRCAYHGWLFSETGQCMETPLEPEDSTFKDRVQMTSYPVEELGGLIFCYLGKQPAPLLPRWDVYVWPNAIRQIGITRLDCNWLQCQENALDLTHDTYLHGHFFAYQLERMGLLEERAADRNTHRAFVSMKRRLSYLEHKRTPFGVQKYSRRAGDPEERITRGPYVTFPNHTSPGHGGMRTDWQVRVPIDDTHTYHINYQVYIAPPGVEVPKQEIIPYYNVPLYDESGNRILDFVLGQDFAAWDSQGSMTDRSREKLGQTDAGIILYRRMLKEQMDLVDDGGVPMNVFWDSDAMGECIDLDPIMGESFTVTGFDNFRNLYHKGYYRDDMDRYGPAMDQIVDLMRRVEEAGALAKV
jgi:5,5'-dehydrodivanillate O-demethylase oxygenase subunit